MNDVPTLRNIWWVAMWSQDLRPGELLARRIMNEPLVFFRGDDGRPAALLDRCPHRWAPLSLGKLVGVDRLRCPYHGLEFGADGTCVRNPHPNYVIPAAMRVRSYPLAEKHSLIWIWMGDAAPDESMIPDFSPLDPDAPEPPGRRDHILMSASWDLIMDNLLDLSHVAYLHDGSLGNASFVDAEIVVEQHSPTSLTVNREHKDVPVTRFMDLLMFGQYPRIDVIGNQRWHAPACLFVDAGGMPVGASRAQGTGIMGYHFLTPETDTSTHYHFVATRWNPISRSDEENAAMALQIADLRKTIFVDEDGAMIAAQQQRVLEAGKENLRPVLLGIDAGVERVHRLLRQLRDNEQLQSATGGVDEMTTTSKTETALDHFIAKTRDLFAREPDPEKRWTSLSPILAELLKDPDVVAASKKWPDCRFENGRVQNLVFYEDPDHKFIINGFVVNQAGYGAQNRIHDHGRVYTLYGLLDGHQRIERYERVDDRSKPDVAELRATFGSECAPGEIDLVRPFEIHAEDTVGQRAVAVIIRSENHSDLPITIFEPETKSCAPARAPVMVPTHFYG